MLRRWMRFVTHCATPGKDGSGLGWSRRVLAAPFVRNNWKETAARLLRRFDVRQAADQRSFKDMLPPAGLPGVDTHDARAWHRPSAARRGHLSARERTLGRSRRVQPALQPVSRAAALRWERVVARTLVCVSADHRNCQDPIAKEFCWGIWIGKLSSGNSNL